MSRTTVDEPRLFAAAVAAALIAQGAARIAALAALLSVVLASVGALTVGVLLLKLVAG